MLVFLHTLSGFRIKGQGLGTCDPPHHPPRVVRTAGHALEACVLCGGGRAHLDVCVEENALALQHNINPKP